MTAQEFCYWLQGFSELNGKAPTPEQWKSIRDHLQLVFTKVTPPVQFPNTIGDPLWQVFPHTTITC